MLRLYKEDKMPNNLHISYDLNSPGQSYRDVENAIRSLGKAIKVTETFWFVSTIKTASEAARIIRNNIDSNDKLYVVDALQNDVCTAYIDDGAKNFIKERWTHRD